MSEGRKPIRVFITHASADHAHARKLRHWLNRQPGTSTFTVDDLSAGENWREKLRDRLAASALFLYIASPHSLESSFVLQELGAAWALEKPIVTVLTRQAATGNLPFQLRQHHVMNLEDFADPDTVRELLSRYREPASA